MSAKFFVAALDAAIHSIPVPRCSCDCGDEFLLSNEVEREKDCSYRKVSF